MPQFVPGANWMLPGVYRKWQVPVLLTVENFALELALGNQHTEISHCTGGHWNQGPLTTTRIFD